MLVALSGGPDSTALLACLAALEARGQVGAVTAGHVDHQLRVDSAADGAACAELCASMGIPLHRVTVDVSPGGNVQAAARRERYRALRRIAAACGAAVTATGHTRSDQAETVVHRLLRGSGARGLAGIPVRRAGIIRPLLERSRAEVLGYLEDRGLSARDDPSNRSPRYLRNRIRWEVLPQLERLAPSVERTLARTAALLRDDDRYLERLARAVAPAQATSARIDALLAAPLPVRRRALRRLWRASVGTRRGLGAEHVDALVKLVRRRGPGSLDLPGGVTAAVAYGTLELCRSRPESAAPGGWDPIVVERDGAYLVPGGALVEVRWEGEAPPPWPVYLRTRRPGDRFRPSRGGGTKKLKAWLIDRKIPRARRDALVVVAARDGRILCVPELGISAEGTNGLSVRLQYCKR